MCEILSAVSLLHNFDIQEDSVIPRYSVRNVGRLWIFVLNKLT